MSTTKLTVTSSGKSTSNSVGSPSMQCCNCQFENMPGVEHCGRCGASLLLASAAIDVHPPRASQRAKRWRRRFPNIRTLPRRVGDAVSTMARAFFGQVEIERPASPVFARMVVPGWPQLYCGQTHRGRLFLGIYVGCLLLGAVFVGTVLGSLLLGLALSCHASSVLDVIYSGTCDWRTRIRYALTCCLVLAVCVYWPVGWLVSRVVTPQVIAMDAPPFRAGDVVLCNPSAYAWSSPRVGDVVLYDIGATRVPGRTAGGMAANYRIQGDRIDRILAGPGQKVGWEDGRLEVDGQPSPWSPLNPEPLSGQLTLTVPSPCYLVLPSTDPYLGTGAAVGLAWQTVCLVPSASIRGKAYLRHQPLSRFWLIK